MYDLKLSPEVADAMAKNAPVVALESTIITHGMPYPQNLETARQVEDDIRAEGAITLSKKLLAEGETDTRWVWILF